MSSTTTHPARGRLLVLALAAALALGGCPGEEEGGPAAGAAPADAAADASADAAADAAADAGPEGLDGAGDDAQADADDAGPDAADTGEPDPLAGWAEVPLAPTEGFLARRAEMLALCLDRSDPGESGLNAQCCRVLEGLDTFDDGPIDAALAQLDARLDTADFRLAGLVRLLYLDNETGALGAERRARIEETLLDFKYWIDEPGDDQMSYWTENHQILYHSGELLAGQLMPDGVFTNTGHTGLDKIAHATPRILRWLDLRGRFGFSEWHSNVYFNEDMPALMNLVDFAEDEEIRRKAAMVLDLMALDLLHNTFRGYFATTHGRTYPSKFLNGLSDSTSEAAYVMLGLSELRSADNFGGVFLATGTYAPPPLLEELAEAVRESSEHRQRDSFDATMGPELGIGYEGVDDIVVWAGMAGLLLPEIINGTLEVLEAYDLWDGFIFGDLPPEVLGLLQAAAGTPELVGIAEELGPLTRGMAMEAIDTYVWRTPSYQLAAAQDFKPGTWGLQTHIWQATLDGKAFVFTTYPSIFTGGGEVGDLAGYDWVGGWQPRATLHRNVGVIQYRRGELAPLVGNLIVGDFSHAFFPRSGFDEVVDAGHWTFGRKGDAYVGLWSEHAPAWAEGNDYQLVATAEANVWVVELGDAAAHGSFEAFRAALSAAEIGVGEDVRYVSPTLGEVRVGWTGPMTVAGEPVDTGPYERWDHATTWQPYGSARALVTLGDEAVDLDFDAGTRRQLRAP